VFCRLPPIKDELPSCAKRSLQTGRKMQPIDIFRRKLHNNNNACDKPSESLSRCLFGAPDVKKMEEFSIKIQRTTALTFSQKWNFDIIQQQPTPSSESKRYEWSEVMDSKSMARSNRHRFDVPLAPNARPTTLLFAPAGEPTENVITSSPSLDQQQSTQSATMDHHQNPALSPFKEPLSRLDPGEPRSPMRLRLRNSTSPSSPMRSKSPFKNTPSKHFQKMVSTGADLSPSPKKFKQGTITGEYHYFLYFIKKYAD